MKNLKTALTIDDEAGIRRSIRAYLEDLGLEVFEAENGERGLETFRAVRPDAILVDLSMPGISGIEVIETINREAPETPVIVVSGTGILEDAIQAVRRGAWDYITKPIHDMGALGHVLKKAAEKAALLKEKRLHHKRLEEEVAAKTAELASANDKLRALLETSLRFKESSSVAKVGTLLLEGIAQAIPVSGGSVYVKNGGGMTRLHSLDPGHAPDFIPFPLPRKTIFGRAIKEKHPLIVKDMNTTQECVSSGWSGYESGSALALPLIDDSNAAIGVLSLHGKQRAPFGDKDVEIGALFASHASATLQAARAAKKLKKTKDFYLSVINSSPDSLMVIDADKNVILANARAMKNFKNIAPQKTRIKCYELSHCSSEPCYDLGFPCPFDDVVGKDDQVRVVEHMHIKGERIERVCQIAAAPVPGSIAGKRQMIHTERDITAQRQMEKALRKSEERYRELVEGTDDLVLTVDSQGIILFVNHVSEQAFGLSPEECKGLSLLSFTHPDDVETTKRKFARWLDEATPGASLENRIVSRDGRTSHLLWTANLHFEKDKSYATINAIGRDITERIKAEADISRLAAAIEHAGESVILTDMQGKITYVNPAFEQITGYERKEALGRTPNQVLRSSLNGLIPFDAIQEAVSKNQSWQGRVISKKKSGEEMNESITVSPIRDPKGMKIGFVSVHRDVTKEMQMETALRQTQKMEAIGSLAGGIAHDFNNILTAILGYANAARLEVPPNSGIAEKLGRILEASNRAASMVKQILTFSRRSEREKKPLMLREIVEEVLSLLKGALPSTIEVKGKIESNSFVNADPDQMHQILMNLGANAGAAMQETGGTLEVVLEDFEPTDEFLSIHPKLKPGRLVKLTVSDTGCGIPAEIMDRIFEPFFTTRDINQGTGLGLSVVHGIVSEHGGLTTVKSEPNHGATFEVYLPTCAAPPRKSRAGTNEAYRGDEKILLVDDEESLVELEEIALSALGYAVTGAANAEEALRLFTEAPDEFDLIITDMTMPGMNGEALAGKIHSMRPEISIIVCSGYAEFVNKDKAETLGIKKYLTKPFTSNELSKCVRQILDGEGGKPFS